MILTSRRRIFAQTEASDFIGRDFDLKRILNHGTADSAAGGMVLLAAPSSGASELLRQACDLLFSAQSGVIPFYFETRTGDKTARNAAVRFLREFLVQTVAFRRNDSGIIDSSPDICEVAELAVPADGHWIDRLVQSCDSTGKLSDDRSFIRSCVSAPLRAAAHGARSFVMIDDLHLARHLDGGEILFEELIDVFDRANIRFIMAGQRRYLFGKTRLEAMSIGPLAFPDAGSLVENLAARSAITINDQTRDLIAVQLGGNPEYTTSLFAAAASGGHDLDTFQRIQTAYTEALFGGRIGKHLDAVLDRVLPDDGPKFDLLPLLFASLAARGGKVPVSYWQKHSGLADADFDNALDVLHCSEIVSRNSGSIEIDADNYALSDYIRGRVGLEIDGLPRGFVFGRALTENVKRAPEIMARFYRRRSTIGLRELMCSFDGQEISPALIDYGRFGDRFKGADDEIIQRGLSTDDEKISLPQIVFTAHTAAFYPKLNDLCDTERSAIALGFERSDDRGETVWIAAEIDSKLEAGLDTTEFWCDLLEMVALNCSFPQFKLWIVAPEGFDSAALALLHDRNAYGSSRKQVDLIARLLRVETPATTAANEYEIIVPMGENSELIAAQAIEEIARRHNFPQKAINQIKTALVEACINAAEHSSSPDRRIYQKFTVDAEKITITVSNRGLRLADKAMQAEIPDEGRRGWGLKLIKSLMDELKFEQTDDGTRLTMVKYQTSE